MKSTRTMMYSVVMALAILAIAGTVVACEGVRTPGYWKNHPEAWPVSNIWTFHGEYYSQDAAIEIMKTSVAGDKSYNLFNAYTAAYLNVCSGAGYGSMVVWAFDAAGMWLYYFPPGSGIAASSQEWKWMEWCFDELQAYNSGLRGVPAAD